MIALLGTRWITGLLAFALSAGGPDASPGAAERAVQQAHESATEGAWSQALAHYRRAQRLRPAPKLHYNIAVCHHRLALQAAEHGSTREHHRQSAIAAYRAYLQAIPDAEDRPAIEGFIRDLGGRPPEGPVIERVEPVASDSPPSVQRIKTPDWSGASGTAPATTPSSPSRRSLPARRPRGQVYFALGAPLMHPVDLTGNDDVEGLALLGGGVQAGAYLGPKRRVSVGGELFLWTNPRVYEHRHGLGLGLLAATVDYRFPFDRIELGVGGLMGLIGENLHRRRPPHSPAPCATADGTGEAISERGGLAFAARSSFSVLLGRRRNHVLTVRATPTLTVFADASKSSDEACEDAPDPFDQFGLPAGSGFGLLWDLGYGIRF